MKRLLLLLLLCLAIGHAGAQEKPFYREYFLNRYLLNPAAAGSFGCTDFSLTDHHQWIGIADAPKSQTFTFHTAIPGNGNSRHGIGVAAYNDINGPHKKIGGQFTYAFHAMMHEYSKTYLSFAASATVYQFSLDESGLFTVDPDPLIGAGTKVVMPNANAGVFLYNPQFYFGASAANLLPEDVAVNDPNVQPDMGLQYAVSGGYKFGDYERGTAFEPSAALILKNNFEKHINVNLRLLAPGFWLGVGYKHNLDAPNGLQASLIPLIGVHGKKFYVAVAHEISFSDLQSEHFGSPYLKLGLRFCKEQGNRRPVTCPAYW